MIKIPAIPMIRVLAQYAAARNIPLNVRSWESIARCFEKYKTDAEKLN